MSNLRLLDPTFSNPFESALRQFFAPISFETEAAMLRMRLDVSEKDHSYVVKADIPGVSKDAIHVRIDGNVVQIDAEIKREKDEKGNGDKLIRSERYYGSISRTFNLAQDVDDEKAQAKYTDGVLTLELPKKGSSEAKNLMIQ